MIEQFDPGILARDPGGEEHRLRVAEHRLRRHGWGLLAVMIQILIFAAAAAIVFAI